MGHRAVALVTGRHTEDDKLKETIRLYSHWGGSPEDLLPDLAAAVVAAQRVLDRRRLLRPELRSVTAKCLADAVRAASLGMNGMDVSLDDAGGAPAVLRGPPTAEAFGGHGDLEWLYVLDADARTVHVYGGYGTAQELMRRGPADPMTRLDGIRDEYKAEVGQSIRAGLAVIRSAGWRVNPAPKPTERSLPPDGEADPRQGL